MLTPNDIKLFELLDEYIINKPKILYFDEEDEKRQIYPTISTVLRYIWEIDETFSMNPKWELFNMDNDILPIYKFDIIKEIKDYSEEQKWELIEFLESI